ncbi:protein kinase-like domain, concanavalin A-like lectin/glucanase domain protein [Tanacetum coccineum]
MPTKLSNNSTTQKSLADGTGFETVWQAQLLAEWLADVVRTAPLGLAPIPTCAFPGRGHILRHAGPLGIGKNAPALFQFSLCDQASNRLERLPAGSISTWEDLTTRFLAQFFLPGRSVKLHNEILMFQQHQGESLSEAWTHFKDLLQKAGGKLRDKNAKEYWAILEDLALYDNESWNDPRDFAKLVKEDEAKEEDGVKSTTTEYKDHKMTDETEEEVESEEESEEETKEEEEDNPEHFDAFPTMKELHYNWIMSNRLEPRRKPSNPKKNCNFVGRVRGLKVFIGNFTYECDFMVLENTTSIIDHDLGSVVFRKPFVETTGLVYNEKEGTVVFEKDKENIVFKMPHKIDMFKHIDFTNIKTDRIPPFVIESDDDNCEKTHFSNNLDLGPEYKYDESVCRAIQSLMTMKARRNKRGVT